MLFGKEVKELFAQKPAYFPIEIKAHYFRHFFRC